MNRTDAIRSQIRELTQQRRRLSAELRRLERATKPKPPRKVRSEVESKAAKEWNAWRPDFCWACHRTAEQWRVEWFGMPITIERAHVTHSGTGNRIEDCRLCVALCTLCHTFSVHGARNPNWTLPKLTQGNMIHLLAVNAPERFDLAFIRRHNVGEPEAAEPLPIEYREERERNRR